MDTSFCIFTTLGLSGPSSNPACLSWDLVPTSGGQTTFFFKGPRVGSPTAGQVGARLQSLVYGDVKGTSENRGGRQRR